MRFLIAFTAIGLAALSSAAAQAENWQKYQPPDIGFSIEMPAAPVLKTDKVSGRPAYSATVAFDKAQAGADKVFLVKYQEARKDLGSDTGPILDRVVKAMLEGNKVLSEKKETLGGYPARRFAFQDADKDTYEVRSVITPKYFIQAIFLGPASDPLGKRFLDSFTISDDE